MLGIKFAPLNIPLQRRLQALSICISFTLFLTMPFLGLFSPVILSGLFLSGIFAWIPLVYGVWYYLTRNVSSTGGLHKPYLRKTWFDRLRCAYFPISLVKTADLDPKERYLLGYHPHGIVGQGILNFSTDVTGFDVKFPGIKPHLISLSSLHRVPIVRELAMLLNQSDSSKENINYIFRKPGTAAIIVIGGAKEMIEAKPGAATLVLKNRKGFVRLAIKNGAHLVPTYTFGENELFESLIDNGPDTRMRKFQLACQKYMGGALPVAINGRGLFNYNVGLMPKRHPLITVVGRPIRLEKNGNPSEKEVDALHKRYMEELRALFDEHKDKYGYGDQSMDYSELS